MRSCPPLGFERKIEIQFISKPFPEVSACFLLLSLPMSTVDFAAHFDQAVLYSLNHCGQE